MLFLAVKSPGKFPNIMIKDLPIRYRYDGSKAGVMVLLTRTKNEQNKDKIFFKINFDKNGKK